MCQFLLGQSIPHHIRDAPEQLKASCLGQIVLSLCALSPVARTLLLLGLQWIFAFIGLVTLAAMDSEDQCPTSPGDDSPVNFGITMFVFELLYITWLLTSLLTAVKCKRVVCCVAPWVEVVVPLVLGFLSYSACVSISTFHVTVARYFPDTCHHDNSNYQLLSTAVAFSWMLFLFALVARLFTRVHVTILQTLQNQGAVVRTNEQPGADMGTREETEMSTDPSMLGQAMLGSQEDLEVESGSLVRPAVPVN